MDPNHPLYNPNLPYHYPMNNPSIQPSEGQSSNLPYHPNQSFLQPSHQPNYAQNSNFMANAVPRWNQYIQMQMQMQMQMQPPPLLYQFNSHTPVKNEPIHGTEAPDFPAYSTQAAVDLTDDVAETLEASVVGRKKHKWSVNDNKPLLNGYFKYGKDPIVARNQKSESFWGSITEHCNKYCDFQWYVDQNHIRNHHVYLARLLTRWSAAFAQATRDARSGWSETDILAAAHAIYKSKHKQATFTLIEEWMAVKDEPRYSLIYFKESTISGSKRGHEDGAVNEKRGFPGTIGSIDCMHWEWRNCPTGWQGQFTRGDKGRSTVILEVVATQDLWIWHAFFGCPCTLNDINVLDRSPVFDLLERGETPKVKFKVNGNDYDTTYYLADGIYPNYPTFVKTIRLPQSEEDKLFATVEEACRKDIERAFGVLQSRFKIIREACRLWEISDLALITRACIILHNMIVEDERGRYAQNWREFDDQSEASGSSTNPPSSTTVLPAIENYVRSRAALRDRGAHRQLQQDLTKHIWAKHHN